MLFADRHSKVVVTFLVLVVLVNVFIIIVFIFIDTLLLFVGVIILLQTAHGVLSGLPILAHAVLRLPHLVMLRPTKNSVFFFTLIVEDLLLFGLLLLSFEGLNNLRLLLPPLLVLQVVHIKLVLQVVDVDILFNIDMVKTLKIGFKSFVFFLILRLDIFQPFQSLFHSLELHLSSRQLVSQFCLVLRQLLDGVLHLRHFICLLVDDVFDALFNINLLSIGVEIS